MASGRFPSPDTGVKALFSPSSGKRDRSALSSPGAKDCSPAKFQKTIRTRFPLEEFDPNSQDSGYDGAGFSDENVHTNFQFAEPLGVAPRRLSLDSPSPVKSPLKLSPVKSPLANSPKIQSRPWHFRSLSSGYESTDDGFNELIDMQTLDEEVTRLPNGLSSLISGDLVSGIERPMECDIATTPETVKSKLAPNTNSARSFIAKRSLYQQNERLQDKSVCGTPPMSKVRSCLFRSPNSSCSTAKLAFESSPRTSFVDSPVRSLKRQESPVTVDPLLVKRLRKCSSFQDGGRLSKKPSFAAVLEQEPDTEAHANIKSAVHRSTTDEDLTGDFSKICILPLAQGQHQDLKSISGETLANLINGEYSDSVRGYTIVDCRYPYEFEAGHIDGALNLYTQELIASSLLESKTATPLIEGEEQKRDVIVFHCEFSWERGPNLSRFLRNLDRQRNKEHYPALHYPEIYLLHGGYHQFHKEHNVKCSPNGYRPMRHPDHEADLRMFRSKSKSWQGEKTSRSHAVTARANLKRLGF